MKKILTVLLSMLLLTGTAAAQRDLNCFSVFQGKVVPGKLMVVTEVRGGDMSVYKLDYYKGVSFQVDRETAAEVAELVGRDASVAPGSQTEMTGELLTYALIQPKGRGKTRRYLCYQARPVGEDWKITILYLEGPATLSDLREMFEKQ